MAAKRRVAFTVAPNLEGELERREYGNVRLSVSDGTLTVFDGPGPAATPALYLAAGHWAAAGYCEEEPEAQP